MSQSHAPSIWRERAGSGAVPSVKRGVLVGAPVVMVFEWNYGDPLPAGLVFTGDANRTKLDATGKVILVGANVPRNDGYVYDKNGLLVPGWLIEGARTNIALQSQAFDVAPWIANSNGTTATANVIAAPDGTTTADLIAETNVTTTFYRRQMLTLAASTTYTYSCYLKNNTRRWVYLLAFDGTTSFAQSFDLQNGVKGTATSGPIVSSGIVPSINGWYRCWITFTVGASPASTLVDVRPSNADAVAGTYLGNTSNSFYAWGADVEAGAFVSSYIPTTSAAVTRAAESCTPPWPYWPQQQTVYVKGINCGTGQLPSTAYLEIGNNTEGIIVWNNAGVLRVSHRVGGTLVQADQAVAPVFGDTFEIRAIINANGSVNSGQSINAAAETTSSVSSTLAFTGAWGVPVIRPSGGVMVSPGFFAFQSIRLALGASAWSMDQMRKIAPQPGRVTVATTGVPAASLVSDGDGSYTLSDTDLTGIGQVVVTGNKGVLYK